MNPAKTRRKHRLREARAAIATASDEELKNMQHELGRQMNMLNREGNELRLRLDAVKLEQEKRRTATPHGIHISDHAVLRYLERCHKVDMAAIRQEIVVMATRAGKVVAGRHGMRRDNESGLLIGVDELKETVTTIFKDNEIPVMETAE